MWCVPPSDIWSLAGTRSPGYRSTRADGPSTLARAGYRRHVLLQRRTGDGRRLEPVKCSKCAVLSLAGIVLVTSLVPLPVEHHRCVVCASPVRLDFDRDDSPHGQYRTDYVGNGNAVVAGGSSSGNVTVTPATAHLHLQTFAPTVTVVAASS
jgi:hypothetical protein